MIIIGTALLMLPQATVEGITLTDAFFTSTSAVCVTGLIVKSTPGDFTLFGKLVILSLIQIGGLGYMSMATFLGLLAGKKIGLYERLLIKESLNIDSFEGIVRLVKGMLIFVFLTEGIGVVILYSRFINEYSPGGAMLQSVFHSVSAFNNSGFTLFDDSLIRYRGDVMINIVVMSLVVMGGIGFTVVDDLYGKVRSRDHKIMLHTRLVLSVTFMLVITGALVFFFNEKSYRFVESDYGTAEQVLVPIFASVTARTAGFNTVDYSYLRPVTLFLTILLMAIGGSPGSTAGGIKTTTFSIVIMKIWCTIRGRRDTVIYRSRIPEDIISKSLVILSTGLIYITFATFIITDMENTPFLETLFETVSAFGTVGLSVGDGEAHSFCANFSDISKWIIIFTMLAGRLGPLTLFMSLLKRGEEQMHYPEGRIMIG